MTAFTEVATAKKFKSAFYSFSLILIVICFSALLSPNISKYTKDGLSLCFNVVIGSVFPFMILTDFISAYSCFDGIRVIRIGFEKLFKINGYAVSAFLVGALCGFPLGVKVAADLYRQGIISKNECERLIGFSNNTGPAFLISGIGIGLRGSFSDGLILYFSMLISAIITGVLFSLGRLPTTQATERSIHKFSLPESVSRSVKNTLTVSGFVVLFSVISGIISIFVKNPFLYSALLSLLEVSGASRFFADISLFSRDFSLILTSFAVSFAGFSVHMQAKSFFIGTDISMRIYYMEKLLQGLISAFITSLVVFIL